MDKVRHIILVLSGKGGVGKSSVTTQLALSLSLQGHSVGVLDIDLTGPSIPRFFGVENAKVKQSPGGWLPVPVYIPPPSTSSVTSDNHAAARCDTTSSQTTENKKTRPTPSVPENENGTAVVPGPIYCMSLGFLLKSRSDAVVWRGPKKTAMVRQFLSDVQWGDLTYLLIDTPPGTSDEHISLLETLLKITSSHTTLSAPTTAGAGSSGSLTHKQLAGAVIVTTPQAVSISDVKKELNFCTKTGLNVLGVIENMAGFVCPACAECTNVFSKGGGEAMARQYGVRFLGSVPIDPAFVALIEEGTEPSYPQGTEIGGKSYAAGKETGMEYNKLTTGSSLVEKYVKCSLAPIFHNFAQIIVGML